MIDLSKEAVNFLLDRLKPKEVLKISIYKSGCTGWAYKVEPVKESLFSTNDENCIIKNGIRIILDSKIVNIIKGSKIVVKEDKFSKVLEFQNPNVKASCGCGESFIFNDKVSNIKN